MSERGCHGELVVTFLSTARWQEQIYLDIIIQIFSKTTLTTVMAVQMIGAMVVTAVRNNHVQQE